MRILLFEDDTLLGDGVCADLRRENNTITNKYVDYATCCCRSVSSRDAAVELTGMYLQRDLQ